MKSHAKKIAFVLGLTLFSTGSSAAVISQGSVDWNFDTPPTYLTYGYIDKSFGFLSDYNGPTTIATRATLASDFTGYLSSGNSSLSVNWDPLTGNSYGTAKSVSDTPGKKGKEAYYGTLTVFQVYTDVLSFAYNYNFNGSKDSVSDLMGYAIQAEVRNANYEAIYSDYDSQVKDFQTNWVYLPNSNNLTVNESGVRSFSFGTAGNFQNWYVRSDVLMVASDSSIPPINVPEPSSIILMMSGLLAIFGARQLIARKK